MLCEEVVAGGRRAPRLARNSHSLMRMGRARRRALFAKLD
jgi:hypothetical protein